MSIEVVKDALAGISAFSEIPNGVRLSTHCLYPSNAPVRVLVMGAGDSFTVSDEAGAFREAFLAGGEVDYSDRKFAKAMSAQGLHMKDGVISSPTVSREALPTAIMLVANASKETADWIFEHWKINHARKFKEILKELLRAEFPKVHEQSIVGESNKPHTFENVVQFMNGSRLLVDAVVKDANSINARVVANLDIANAGYENLHQRIVYDDDDEWSAADLSLLRVSKVGLIPFSKSQEVLKGFIQ